MSTPASPGLFPPRVYRIGTLLHASRNAFEEYRRATAEQRPRAAQLAERRWRQLRAEADRVSGGEA